MTEEAVFKIGKIGKPHGVKGEVTLLWENDFLELEGVEYLFLNVDGIPVPFFIEGSSTLNNGMTYLKFEDIDTLEQARELTGDEVLFPQKWREDAETVSKEETLGFTLYDTRSKGEVGTITGIDTSTLNALFEVTGKDGKRILVPASEDFIKAVDRTRHRVDIELPEGLLDL